MAYFYWHKRPGCFIIITNVIIIYQHAWWYTSSYADHACMHASNANAAAPVHRNGIWAKYWSSSIWLHSWRRLIFFSYLSYRYHNSSFSLARCIVIMMISRRTASIYQCWRCPRCPSSNVGQLLYIWSIFHIITVNSSSHTVWKRRTQHEFPQSFLHMFSNLAYIGNVLF